MARSDAEICNLALARIGSTSFIDSLEEATAEAQVCRVLYPQARDAQLQASDWSFALRRAELVRLPGFERSGWGAAFALPPDCLVPRSIFSGLRNPRMDQAVPWTIEEGADQRILLCDLDAAELQYTARITAPTLLPPLFVDALAWAMACELAIAIPVKEGIEARARQQHQLALSRAIAADLNQGQPDPPPESPLISVRS